MFIAALKHTSTLKRMPVSSGMLDFNVYFEYRKSKATRANHPYKMQTKSAKRNSLKYSMWSLVRASPRCPWSATFPKMIKYFVEKKNTLNNERYHDLLISILSYDEVSAFLLWVKTQN